MPTARRSINIHTGCARWSSIAVSSIQAMEGTPTKAVEDMVLRRLEAGCWIRPSAYSKSWHVAPFIWPIDNHAKDGYWRISSEPLLLLLAKLGNRCKEHFPSDVRMVVY